MTTDAQALAIATRALPQEPRAALHVAVLVGRTETHYGDNWDALGAGSNKWGAVQATDMSQPAFPHLDHHADGSPYMAAFRKYPTPEAGFKDMAFTVLKPNVVEAAERGDGTLAVHAMHDNGYFELDPAKYAAAMEKQYNAFLASTGEERLLSFDGTAPAASGEAPAAAGGVSAVDLLIGAGLAWGAVELAAFLAPAKATPKGSTK